MNSKNEVSLFYVDSQLAVSQLRDELAQVTRRAGYELSIPQVTEVYEARNEALVANHLIDFSLANTIQLTKILLDREKLSAKSLVNDLTEAMDIFYYLRAAENTGYSDEDLIIALTEVLDHYAGDLENVKGYFESNPQLTEEVCNGSWISRKRNASLSRVANESHAFPIERHDGAADRRGGEHSTISGLCFK